jgi:DNA cross-link repair 1A protein
MVGFHQLYQNASKKLDEARASLQLEPLFIRPSTQWYASYPRNQKPCLTEAEQDEFRVWHICFSIHSSRDELEQALQLLQPQWVISTTPPCFAIELSYVRKHCFKTRLTADDPLWKIFRDPLGKSVSSPSSVLAPETHTDADHSNFVDDDEHSSPASNECTYLDSLELNFVSCPPEEPDITLFGRARFASQAINIMEEELCNQFLSFEETTVCAPADLPLGSSEEVETYSAMDVATKQVPSCLQEHVETGEEVHLCQCEPSPVLSEIIQVQSLPTVESDMSRVADQHEKSEAASESKPLSSAEDSNLSVIQSAERTDCQKEPLCIFGSSKCLNASLKRLYRSRNIPVPRPLPSLVRLLESSKRVKRQQSTNSTWLNSFP